MATRLEFDCRGHRYGYSRPRLRRKRRTLDELVPGGAMPPPFLSPMLAVEVARVAPGAVRAGPIRSTAEAARAA